MSDATGAHSHVGRNEPITGVKHRQHSGEVLVLAFVNLLHDCPYLLKCDWSKVINGVSQRNEN
jgi:hypothetical protein